MIAAIASVIVALAVLLAAASLARTLRQVRLVVDDVRREALPLVADARATVDAATGELSRVHNLLGSAESVSATVDSASRLAYLAFSNPLIKALALASGTGRAARRLRRRRDGAAGS